MKTKKSLKSLFKAIFLILIAGYILILGIRGAKSKTPATESDYAPYKVPTVIL